MDGGGSAEYGRGRWGVEGSWERMEISGAVADRAWKVELKKQVLVSLIRPIGLRSLRLAGRRAYAVGAGSETEVELCPAGGVAASPRPSDMDGRGVALGESAITKRVESSLRPMLTDEAFTSGQVQDGDGVWVIMAKAGKVPWQGKPDGSALVYIRGGCSRGVVVMVWPESWLVGCGRPDDDMSREVYKTEQTSEECKNE